jgi:hypothetical protein
MVDFIESKRKKHSWLSPIGHRHRTQIALATALNATATRPPPLLVQPPINHHTTTNTLDLATTNPPPIH